MMFWPLVQRRLPLSASKSASKKSAKFDDDPVAEVRLSREATKPDAAEEVSAAVESPRKSARLFVTSRRSSASRPNFRRKGSDQGKKGCREAADSFIILSRGFLEMM